jgi:hypothetical protein
LRDNQVENSAFRSRFQPGIFPLNQGRGLAGAANIIY